MSKEPTRQEIVQLINSIAGANSIDEAQLDQFIAKARQAYETGGEDAVFEHIRQATNLSFPNSFMKIIASQLSNFDSIKQFTKDKKF